GVSFSVGHGETLGLVGESGCGKSTVARSVMRLVEPTSGRICLDGEDITHLSKAALRTHRRSMQIVFQDPFASLNPRMTAGAIVGEPLAVHGLASGRALEARVADLFAQVGLRPDQMRNFPHQFSGGQRQRIAIARAIIRNPSVLLLDEATSALDAESERLVQEALERLMAERTTLVIAHRLATVRAAERIIVMSDGRIVEQGSHGTLVEQNGLYARLASLQFSEAA
ncbi:dipeptide/oligopeptide/nickel ABC transporter ATP-binding protein, partial [Pseudomonas proteolytica]|uniref:dipeptide/oligopeptide/nickel ABC transporter ATP-binding protein n=1 Tax=Pseudomonas proteolytica TaxID=219574 RepID=UPI0030DA095E